MKLRSYLSNKDCGKNSQTIFIANLLASQTALAFFVSTQAKTVFFFFWFL